MKLTEDKYPTRVEGEEKVIDRCDPVIYGKEIVGCGLNNEQLKFYNENGYLIIPNLLTDKVEQLLSEIPDLTDRMRGKEELVFEPGTDAVRSLFAPELFSDVYDQVTKDKRILNIAQQILNSDVYIYQSRINIKQAQVGKRYDWHSDFETWHVEDGVKNIRIFTATVLLTENNMSNGPLSIIPKSHLKFVTCSEKAPEGNFKNSLRKQVYGVPSESVLNKFQEQFGKIDVCASAGSLILHDGNLLHGSDDNNSVTPRTNYFIVYNSIENIPGKPFGASTPRPEFLSRRDYTPLKSCS